MRVYDNIMLVDDDADACFLNKRTINALEIKSNVVTCAHGKEALNFLSNNCLNGLENKRVCPDIIFLDIKMPVMDGFEFLEEFVNLPLKNHKPKVIILTSSDHKADFEKAQKFKVDGYIVKPLTKDKLKTILID